MKLLTTATEVEHDPTGMGVFGSRLIAQLSLPYSDPGDAPEWVRRNNAMTLTLTPGPVTGPDGTRTRKYPYGVIPRYLLTWVTTEAVKTQSRVLDLGDSLSGFLRQLGLNGSGASGRRTMEQLARLVAASLHIEDARQRPGGRYQLHGENFSVASSYDLWFGINDPETPTLLPSTITLSESFYAETMRTPVLLNPRVLRALSGSAMRLDMYTWLQFRTRNLSKASVVSWAQLQAQFGADYKAARQFKAAFLRQLEEVQLFFPEKTITMLKNGIRLNAKPKNLRSKTLGVLVG
ncbi:MAG: replication protein RepA [Galactobacter sp.]